MPGTDRPGCAIGPADIETLKFSNDLGGAGFSGISGNFYPWIMSALVSQHPLPIRLLGSPFAKPRQSHRSEENVRRCVCAL